MQKHRKAKEIQVGGKTYWIAPLTMAQIETWVEVPPTEDPAETRLRLWSQIEASMQNADPENAPSMEDLRETVDLEDFRELLLQVREISRLVVVAPKLTSEELSAFARGRAPKPSVETAA